MVRRLTLPQKPKRQFDHNGYVTFADVLFSMAMDLSSCQKAAELLQSCTGNSDVEEFWAVALNPSCHVIASRMLFRGTVDSCWIHPRDVFRFAIIQNATQIIVGHNHPSGVCMPSEEDQRITKRLLQAGRLLQMPLLDHLIVTKDGYFSFAQNGWRNSMQ